MLALITKTILYRQRFYDEVASKCEPNESDSIKKQDRQWVIGALHECGDAYHQAFVKCHKCGFFCHDKLVKSSDEMVMDDEPIIFYKIL